MSSSSFCILPIAQLPTKRTSCTKCGPSSICLAERSRLCMCLSARYPLTSLVKFKGRVAFRQFIPSKRARFGLKFFALCDKSGYFYDPIVYHGKLRAPLPITDQLGAAGALVIALMDNLLDRGHQLCLDNFTHPAISCLPLGVPDWDVWHGTIQSCQFASRLEDP